MLPTVPLRLELNGIQKSFGATQALREVSLSLGPGEAQALIGENGAGKSTLMKLIPRLYAPHQGRILIDGYETNEPVLNGNLEVEFNGIKATAKFHADHGDYVVDDANLLKALAKPGKHALLFTFSAGKDNDLLEGTLDVSAHDGTHIW